MKCFKIEDGETSWIIAENKEQALEYHKENINGDLDDDGYEVTICQGDEMLTITSDEPGPNGGLLKETKSIDEWIKDCEKYPHPCPLCSTVW